MLAGLMRSSETAVVCDLAEYYHVLNWRALPLRTVAMLVAGLREDSRTMMLATGQKIRLNSALLAASVDRLSMLLWAKSKDGQKNRKRPESILQQLTEEHQPADEYEGFETGEEFMEARRRIMEGS